MATFDDLPALQLGNTRTQRDINTIITWLRQWAATTDGIAAGSAHLIKDDGSELPQRPILDFVGDGVKVLDYPGTNTTRVVIGSAALGEDISGSFKGELLNLAVTGELILKGTNAFEDNPATEGGVIRSDNFVTGVSGWQIDHSGVAEFQNATIRGDITAESGLIGGWTIGASDLYAGSGAARVGLRPGAWPFYAGGEDPTTAPFRVSVAGLLTAQGATIEGTVTAGAGAIGGFGIGSDYIRDANDSMGLASVVTAGDDVRFWAGDTFANRATAPFRVTKGGLLTAQGATIEGAITATTGELVDLDVSGLLNLVAGGIIQSDDYSGGESGWRIDYNGDAEFNNVHVRGTIDTMVFQYDQISAISGSLLVTPTAGALGETYTTGGTLTIEGDAWAFATGDVVRIRALDVTGAVKQAWVTVTRTGTTNVYTTVKQSGDDATWPVGTAVLGYGTGGGSLMMTAADALDGPRYSVNAHGTSPWTDEAEIGRFGLLDGWDGYVGNTYGIGMGDYNGGNYLLYNPTDGFVLEGGSGQLTLDENGLRLRAWTLGEYNPPNAVSWIDSSGILVGSLWADDLTTIDGKLLKVTAEVGPGTSPNNSSLLALKAKANYTGKNASVQLIADSLDEYAAVTITANEVSHNSYVILDVDEVDVTKDLWFSGNGMIRDSYPMHLRLTRRGSAQGIASGAWAYRYMNTVEYASAGSGIAGSDLRWMHSPLVFVGSGLNDLTHLGLATYPESFTTQFQVKITATGTPDSFQYSMDNGATWNGTNIAITGAEQSIGGTKDVRIKFGATTGHTLNDRWSWDELPRYMIVANRAGMYSVVSGGYYPATNGVTVPYRIQMAVRKNGVEYQADSTIVMAGAEKSVAISCSSLVWLNVGDWIDCPVYQDSGVNKNIAAATDTCQDWNVVTIARIA